MLGAIIKIASAGAAVLGVNYVALSRVIPAAAKIAASKVFAGVTPLLDIALPTIQGILGENIAHAEAMRWVENFYYKIGQITLGVVWGLCQVLIAKNVFYENWDTTAKLLGLSSADEHASQPEEDHKAL